jgi:hypothetical protein
MKHRWARPRFRRSNIKHENWHRPSVDSIPIKFYCIQCGAMRFFIRTKNYYGFWKVFMRPYDGILKEVRHIPPCEGLPPNYEMPIGA